MHNQRKNDCFFVLCVGYDYFAYNAQNYPSTIAKIAYHCQNGLFQFIWSRLSFHAIMLECYCHHATATEICSLMCILFNWFNKNIHFFKNERKLVYKNVCNLLEVKEAQKKTKNINNFKTSFRIWNSLHSYARRYLKKRLNWHRVTTRGSLALLFF